MNTQVKYIKPFSNGQITIPKEFRDAYDIHNDSWLKLIPDEGKFIIEPVREEKKMSKEEYRNKLLSIKGVWDLGDEINRSREESFKKEFDRKAWIKRLLKMPALDIDVDELAENRRRMEEKIKSRAL